MNNTVRGIAQEPINRVGPQHVIEQRLHGSDGVRAARPLDPHQAGCSSGACLRSHSSASGLK